MNVDIDKVEQIKKYFKYVLILIPIVIILLIIKSCGKESYNSLESKVKTAVSNYINEKNLTIMGEQYIELSDLDEIEGLELCSSASGALVENKNGKILITPYLDCKGYKSDILKNKGKYIELNGDTIMLLNKGEVFNDPLYTLKRDADVEIDGIVGSTPGVYTIKYNVSFDNELKETLIRKVIVVNSDKTKMISGIESVTDPTLVLYGDTEIVLAKGEKYVEPGYKAVDYVDGKISRQVRVDSKSVNTSATGTYTITYTVENSRGKTAFKIRTVNVVSKKANITINLTNNLTNNVGIIKINVIGSGYDYLYLPDQTKVDSREVTYEAKKNGNYIFRVFDSYGNRYTKEIMIDGIDEVAPSGTCKAISRASSTDVSVDAIDNKGISGYSYILDGIQTEYTSSNTYKANQKSKNVKVKIKDISSNEITINCEVEEKKYDEDGIRVLVSGKPRLRVPIEVALKEKGHTVAEFNKCIADRVKEAGVGTRDGVVAAAYALIDCNLMLTGTVLSYDHTGGKVHISDTNYCAFNSSICGKLGVNLRWGKQGGACPSSQCYYGLNCATFVRWSMCNGGMDLCTGGAAGAFSMTSKTYFKEADGVTIDGRTVKYYSGADLTKYSSLELVKMLKPGDIAARSRHGDSDGSSDHTFVIIGRDETGIYTANDGYYINKISYSSMINGEYKYRLLFLDKYYDNPSNRNNLYH